MSQLPLPAVQVTVHTPREHTADDPVGPAGQALPHLPQCMRLARVLVSQPLAVLPPQSPVLAG